MYKRALAIITSAVMALTLSAPVFAEETASTDISIGVSFGQNVHPFFVAMQKGIEMPARSTV